MPQVRVITSCLPCTQGIPRCSEAAAAAIALVRYSAHPQIKVRAERNTVLRFLPDLGRSSGGPSFLLRYAAGGFLRVAEGASASQCGLVGLFLLADGGENV